MLWLILIPFIVPIASVLFLLWTNKVSVKSQDDWTFIGMYAGILFLSCGIISALVGFGGTSKTRFYEVWNYKINEVRFYERWNEQVTYTEEETYTETDSKGNSHTKTRTVTKTRIDDHPAHWEAVDEYGDEHSIDQESFEEWARLWNMRQWKNLHRDYHTINGNMYFAQFDGKFEHIFPWSDIRTYVNKVRASDSVFNYAEPTKEQLARFPRPADKNNTSPIISYGPKFTEMEELLLRRTNANLGRAHRVHCMFVLFDADKDGRNVIDEILAAWKGVNKNELVVFMGLDSQRNVKWVEVVSWMDDTTIHANLRDQYMAMGHFDVSKISLSLHQAIPSQWKKKDFRDFNYLHVYIHWGWYLTEVIAVVIAAVLVYFWVEAQKEKNGFGYRRRW